MADGMNAASVVDGEEGSHLRWYQGISSYAWMVLVVAALGWMFDTMDQNIFNLVRLPSLKDILHSSLPASEVEAAAKALGGQVTAIFLLGWAAGGFLFGMIGDKLGRTKTMALTIITYAAFTGLTGLTHTPLTYGFCRFMTALGVGGEFAAGASLVAEVFPSRSRAMALGSLQALSAVGNIMAALVTLGLSNVANSWRWAFAVGALPAVLVYFIMRRIEEPQKWVDAKAKAKASDIEMGTIAGLFRDPV
ncbi:MAG: MFS transporter, partial [Abitibacteriaceae bacterium]|nr:MFS transporter [Abditibacteriaceae bacterium]